MVLCQDGTEGWGENRETPSGWRFENQVGLYGLGVLRGAMGCGPAVALGTPPPPSLSIFLLDFRFAGFGCCLLPGTGGATGIIGRAWAVVGATIAGVPGGSFCLFGGAIAGPVTLLPA